MSAGIEPIDLELGEAKAITNRIRQHVEIALVEIKKAYTGRAWISLGYDSWADYCTNEFGEHVSLPRDARRQAVAGFADVGMSTRAIAAATGASKSTIADDLAGVQNRTPGPDDDIVDAEIVDESEARQVTGVDGKTYPVPPAPRRYPITKTAQRLDFDIEKMARRIERFLEDDRVRTNRENPILRRLDRAADQLVEQLANLSAAIPSIDENWIDGEVTQ